MAKRRCLEILEAAQAAANRLAGALPRKRGRVTARVILTGPKRPSVFDELVE